MILYNYLHKKFLSLNIKNSEIIDILSLCLLNSIKFKNEKEINDLIKNNIDKIEKIIKGEKVSYNIIKLIKKTDKNVFQ